MAMHVAVNIVDNGCMAHLGKVMMQDCVINIEHAIGCALPVIRAQEELGMEAICKTKDGAPTRLYTTGSQVQLIKHQGMHVIDCSSFLGIRQQLAQSP